MRSPTESPTRKRVPRLSLGHRYLVISFMMAKPTLRCSLLLTVFSLRSVSLADASFLLPVVLLEVSKTAGAGFWILSGLIDSTPNASGLTGSAFKFCIIGMSFHRDDRHEKLRHLARDRNS